MGDVWHRIPGIQTKGQEMDLIWAKVASRIASAEDDAVEGDES